VPHISLLEGTVYRTMFLADEEGIDDEQVAKAGVYPIHQRISIRFDSPWSPPSAKRPIPGWP